jgi:ATP-binding cassette subfamily F protein uup
MDEPTNDLDIETLELLEEMLIEYKGTLLLVSHDRDFIDNTVTSTLVFEAPGVVNAYVGGYQDWLRQRMQKIAPAGKPIAKKAASSSTIRKPDQKELLALPGKIEKLELKIAAIHEQFSEPGFYQQESEAIRPLQQKQELLQSELDALYQRWEALEGD